MSEEIKAILPVVPVEIQAADATGATRTRTFELTAYTGEPIRQWWSDESIVVDVASMEMSQQSIPALYNHDAAANCIVGQINAIRSSDKLPPVIASGIFTPTDEEGDMCRMVLAKADAGYKWQASIRGPAASMENIAAGVKVIVNGREFVGPIKIARGVQLREVSFVVLGADRNTSAVVATDSQTPIGAKAMDETQEAVIAPVEAAVETEAETTTETVAASEPVQPVAPVAELRAKRPDAPHVIVRNNPEGKQLMRTLQGAMLIRAGGDIGHKCYGTLAGTELLKGAAWLRAGINDSNRNQIMESAAKYSKLSAIDIARESLRASGIDVPFDRDDMLRLAFSSGSLTNSMTTSANAILLAAFMEEMDSTQEWVAETDVSNYLTNERVRVLNGDSMSLHPRNTAADHSTISDVAETYKINRFSKQFMVDEIDFINDSLGALGEMPRRYGPMARRLKPDLVYALVMSNPTLAATSRAFFNSTDANLLTTTAFSKANLSVALARMRVITEGGVSLNIRPTHLIVPATLHDTAYQVTTSPTETSGATGGQGTTNPIYGYGLKPVTDSRLENGVDHPVTGTNYAGSTSTWYLASADNPCVEVGYLRGTGRAPRVVTNVVNGEGGIFGVNWVVSHSIGGVIRDWKGFQKHTA